MPRPSTSSTSLHHSLTESYTARNLVGGAFELFENIRRSRPARGGWWPQEMALEGLGVVTAMAMEHGNAPPLVDFLLFKFSWPADHLSISLVASNQGEPHAMQAFQRALSTTTRGEKHFFHGHRYVFHKPDSPRNDSWVDEKVAYRWKLDTLAMTSSAFHAITRQLSFRSVSNGAHCQITVTDVAATRILALSNLMIIAKKLQHHFGPLPLQDCLTAGEALLVLVTLEQLRPVMPADGHQWDGAVSKIFPTEAAYLRVTGDSVRIGLLDFYTIHIEEISQAYVGDAGAGIVVMFEAAARSAMEVHVMQFMERPYPHHLVSAHSLSKMSHSAAFTPLSRSSFYPSPSIFA